MKIPTNLFYTLVLLCTSSSPFDDSNKKEELPPITQEGRNTFGCLVNGEVWLPKGYNGTSNLDLSYDPTYMNGAFNLGAIGTMEMVTTMCRISQFIQPIFHRL